MPVNFWNKRPLRTRRLVLEQLEERIVLDASIDASLCATDTMPHLQAGDVLDALHDARPAAGLTSQVYIENSDAGFFGRHAPDEWVVDDNSTFVGRGVQNPPDHSRTVEVVSELAAPATLYVSFNTHPGHDCAFGENGQYSLADFPGFEIANVVPVNCMLISRTINPGDPVLLNFNHTNGLVDFNIAVDAVPQKGCSVTQAEFALHAHWAFNDSWHDDYDLSLVNGFNKALTLDAPYGEHLQVTSALGNNANLGVYPLGNDLCTKSCSPPAGCVTDWEAAYGSGVVSAESKSCGGTDPSCPDFCSTPTPVCHLSHDQSTASGKVFTLTIAPPV